MTQIESKVKAAFEVAKRQHEATGRHLFAKNIDVEAVIQDGFFQKLNPKGNVKRILDRFEKETYRPKAADALKLWRSGFELKLMNPVLYAWFDKNNWRRIEHSEAIIPTGLSWPTYLVPNWIVDTGKRTLIIEVKGYGKFYEGIGEVMIYSWHYNDPERFSRLGGRPVEMALALPLSEASALIRNYRTKIARMQFKLLGVSVSGVKEIDAE